jgi:hypothetical protein
MSKELKVVSKNLFGRKSKRGQEDTLFRGSTSGSSRWDVILKHIDPTLVGRTVCYQRSEVILIFSYHFAILIYWLFYILFCRTLKSVGPKDSKGVETTGGWGVRWCGARTTQRLGGRGAGAPRGLGWFGVGAPRWLHRWRERQGWRVCCRLGIQTPMVQEEREYYHQVNHVTVKDSITLTKWSHIPLTFIKEDIKLVCFPHIDNMVITTHIDK